MEHTYKHLTKEQVDSIGSWRDEDTDDEHLYMIQIGVENLVDWFNNVPDDDEFFEFSFSKEDGLVSIWYPNPVWWCEIEDEAHQEMERIILEKLYLKEEWIEQFGL